MGGDATDKMLGIGPEAARTAMVGGYMSAATLHECGLAEIAACMEPEVFLIDQLSAVNVAYLGGEWDPVNALMELV